MRPWLILRWEYDALESAIYGGGFKCVVPKGTILVADHDSVRLSTGFVVVPDKHAEMEEMLVSKEDSAAQKYAEYSLVLSYRLIGKRLRKI